MKAFVRRLSLASALLCFAGLAVTPTAAAPDDAIKLKPPGSVASEKGQPDRKNQPPVKAEAPQAGTKGEPQPPRPPVWATACSGANRNKPLDCAVEQRLQLQNGQLVTLVRVSIPAGTHKPTLLVEAPLGLSIRSGVSLQLDGQEAFTLDFKTCDQGGCYAASPLPPGVLRQMLSAKTLTVRVMALNMRAISMPLSLDGFADAYAKIS